MVRKEDIEAASKDENKLKEGGIKWDRTCTDVICCLVFMVFLVTMVGLSFIGFTKGDPLRLLTPYDSVGNMCGAAAAAQNTTFTTDRPIAVDMTLYPYKYYS